MGAAAMSRWAEVVASAPEFADSVRQIFDSRRHKTLATLRKDGSPRVSGIELSFVEGDVVMGMMEGSVKWLDLSRDSRMAVHGISDDPPVDDPGRWAGDVKISGRAVEIPGPSGAASPSNSVRLDVSEVVWTRVGTPADHLVIETWHPDRGLQRRVRR
jgi:hypothetical protein